MLRDAGANGTITFTFEDREVECRAGVSVAAALANVGEFELRDLADGDTRGVFCGMGVCQDCRVTVNGEHGKRACMIMAFASSASKPNFSRMPSTCSTSSLFGSS